MVSPEFPGGTDAVGKPHEAPIFGQGTAQHDLEVLSYFFRVEGFTTFPV